MATALLPVLVLVRDLIFATKISSTAKAVGSSVKMVRDPAALGNEPGRLLLVDLNLPGAIEAAGLWRTGPAGGTVVGFISHVDADTAARAREAGIGQVMARSRFVEVLPELLRE
ncbi:MAG TPA: hypothetical protein VG269_01060 [Tepidisphaeraceae bacterium]|nr:hypothetical protein [Tepidisphaeraceae bacterium]